MNHEEYIYFVSEITELKALLAEIPSENVLERIGLEARLEDTQKRITAHHRSRAGLRMMRPKGATE